MATGILEFAGMAKRRNTTAEQTTPPVSERLTPAQLRRGSVKVADLQQMINKCRDHLAEVSAYLTEGEEAGVTEFILDGVTQLSRAEDELFKFTDNVRKGVRSAMRSM